MRISDWSSDVCSSDLLAAQESRNIQQVLLRLAVADALGRVEGETRLGGASGCPGGRPRGRTAGRGLSRGLTRSEEHTSELQSLMRISYAVFCLKKTKKNKTRVE